MYWILDFYMFSSSFCHFLYFSWPMTYKHEVDSWVLYTHGDAWYEASSVIAKGLNITFWRIQVESQEDLTPRPKFWWMKNKVKEGASLFSLPCVCCPCAISTTVFFLGENPICLYHMDWPIDYCIYLWFDMKLWLTQ